MTPKASKKEFVKHLEAGGNKWQAIPLAKGIEAMLAFYAGQRAEGCELEEDGDMLLFQWGEHETEDGDAFMLDITRQFMITDDEDQEPFQLSLRYYFEPTPALRKLKSGNEWCSTPDELPAFRKLIEKSAAYQAVAGQTPKSVELDFEAC